MHNVEKKAISPEEKKNFIEQWKSSGLSKKEFSEQQGLRYNTFVTWFVQKKSKKPAGGFREVSVATLSPVFAELVRGDLTIRFHQPFPAEYFHALLR
jgi:hypothetical protein